MRAAQCGCMQYGPFIPHTLALQCSSFSSDRTGCGVVLHAAYWGVEVDVVPVFSHRGVLCTRFLAFCSHLMLLDGNFPCAGLNACDAAHDFNFFLLSWSLGLHVRLFVCDIFYCLCSSICVLSAFWTWVCVCVYMSREFYSREHAGFWVICRAGHEAWIAQWLRSRPRSEVAPIRIQTTQAKRPA